MSLHWTKENFLGPITALKKINLENEDIIIWASGGGLYWRILENINESSVQSNAEKKKFVVFPNHNIYGIKFFHQFLLVFGEKSIKLYSASIRNRELVLDLFHQFIYLDDMIMDSILIPSSNDSNLFDLYIGYAHNFYDKIQFNKETKAFKFIERILSPDITVLFSLSFGYYNNNIIVASGSVFGKLSLWRKYQEELNEDLNEIQSTSHLTPSPLLTSTTCSYKLYQGKVLTENNQNEGVIFCIKFSNSFQHLITVADDRTVRLWKISYDLDPSFKFVSSTSIEQLFIGWGHVSRPWDADFLVQSEEEMVPSTSAIIASCGEDGTVRLWNLKGECISTLVSNGGDVWKISVLNDGRIAAGGNDSVIRFWNIKHHLKLNLQKKEKSLNTYSLPSSSSHNSSEWKGVVNNSGASTSRRANSSVIIRSSPCGRFILVVSKNSSIWLIKIVESISQEDASTQIDLIPDSNWILLYSAESDSSSEVQDKTAHNRGQSSTIVDAEVFFSYSSSSIEIFVASSMADNHCRLSKSIISFDGELLNTISSLNWKPHPMKTVKSFIFTHKNDFYYLTSTLGGFCSVWKLCYVEDRIEVSEIAVLQTGKKEIVTSILLHYPNKDVNKAYLMLGDARGSISVYPFNWVLLSSAPFEQSLTSKISDETLNSYIPPANNEGGENVLKKVKREVIDAETVILKFLNQKDEARVASGFKKLGVILPSLLLAYIHGTDPVTCMVSSSECMGFFSTGQDSTLSFYKDIKLSSLYFDYCDYYTWRRDNWISSLPISTPTQLWIFPSVNPKISPYCPNIYVGGYQGSDYMIWDLLMNRQVLCVEGGAWKRPHNSSLNVVNSNGNSAPQLNFACLAPSGKTDTVLLYTGSKSLIQDNIYSVGSPIPNKVINSCLIVDTPSLKLSVAGGEDPIISIYSHDDFSLVQWSTLPKNSTIKTLSYSPLLSDSNRGLIVGAGGKLMYFLFAYDTNKSTEDHISLPIFPLRRIGDGNIGVDAGQDHRIMSSSVVYIGEDESTESSVFLIVLGDSRGWVTIGMTSVRWGFQQTKSIDFSTTQRTRYMTRPQSPMIILWQSEVSVCPILSLSAINTSTGVNKSIFFSVGDTKGLIKSFFFSFNMNKNTDNIILTPQTTPNPYSTVEHNTNTPSPSYNNCQLVFEITNHFMGVNCLQLYSEGKMVSGNESLEKLVIVSGGDCQSIGFHSFELKVKYSDVISLNYLPTSKSILKGAASSSLKGTHIINSSELRSQGGNYFIVSSAYDQRLSLWNCKEKKGGSLKVRENKWKELSTTSSIMEALFEFNPTGVSECDWKWLSGVMSHIGEVSCLSKSVDNKEFLVCGQGIEKIALKNKDL